MSLPDGVSMKKASRSNSNQRAAPVDASRGAPARGGDEQLGEVSQARPGVALERRQPWPQGQSDQACRQ